MAGALFPWVRVARPPVPRKGGAAGPPLRGGEPVTLEAGGGQLLRGELLIPASPVVAVALSHAMMVDRRTLDRPKGAGLLTALVEHGAAVLWFDQRGHGQSGPGAGQGADWSYDDLVADAGVAAGFLRGRFPGLPLAAIGHSLFGHVALAYQGRASSSPGMQRGGSPGKAGRGGRNEAGPPLFDRLVLLGGNVWLPQMEPLRTRWWRKRAVLEGALGLVRLWGRLPCRLLRLGSEDEPATYWRQFVDWARTGDWTDLQGGSYLAGLAAVDVPVLSIAGAGDRLLAAPAAVQRFLATVRGPVEQRLVGRATGYAADPNHMDLVLDPRMRPMWDEIARWVTSASGRAPPAPPPAPPG